MLNFLEGILNKSFRVKTHSARQEISIGKNKQKPAAKGKSYHAPKQNRT